MVLDQYIANSKRVRQAVDEAKRVTLDAQNDTRRDALDYYDGRGSGDLIREKYANRYGYRLETVIDANGMKVKRYARGLAPSAIESGFYQIKESKTLQRVVRSVATMFTQADQKWEYVSLADDGTVEPDDEAAKVIAANRKAGGFNKELIRTDRVSVVLSSAAVRVRYHAGHLKYDGGLGPQSFHLVWPDYIVEDDGSKRAPDRRDIEDAERVIVELENSASASSGGLDSLYVAYFGRSEKYEHGRMVTYRSRDPFVVPDVGTDGAQDYVIGDTVANPLTALQDGLNGVQDGFDLCPHEYPIVVMYGQDVPVDEVFPESSFSLYDGSVEDDLQLSRLLFAVDRSAVGSIGVKNPEGAALPENPGEGTFELKSGQEIDVTAIPSSGSKDGVDVLRASQLQFATGYGVPGFEVVSDGNGAPESGAALYVRSQPKIDARTERVNENETVVHRLFEIERGLLAWFGSDQQQVGAQVDQRWSAGSWRPPRSEEERIAAATAKYSVDAIDYVGLVAEVHETDRVGAKKIIDQLREDSADYPKPAQAGARGAGGRLPSRR